MSEEPRDHADEMPVPLPDMAVVEEMQMGIVNRFADVKEQKAAGRPVVYCSVRQSKRH